jgi:hypothetical protein
MPQVRPHFLEAGPVHVAREPVHELIPRGGTFGAAVPRMRVDPVLKRIHRRDPAQHADDAFQMRAPAARLPSAGG